MVVKNKLLFLFMLSVFIIFVSTIMPFVFAAGGGGGGDGGGSGGSSSSSSSSGGSSCKVDIWTCTDWTACDRYNHTQARTCELTKDCPGDNSVKPVEFATCEYVSDLLGKLKCQKIDIMRDRIACRLSLTEEEQAQELELQYLPEECRPIANIDDKEQCVQTYAKLQKCWMFPDGDVRINCVKEQIGLKSLDVAKKNCAEKEGTYKSICLNEINKLQYWIIKFRFYDLEERAEKLMESNPDLKKAIVIDFITAVEEKKLEFNQAATKEKKKQIILEVRELWKDFVKKARADLKSKQQ